MINFNSAYNAKEIIHAIQKCDSVSFDIFDTLVKRSFATPSDLFFRIAKDIKGIVDFEVDPNDFVQLRITAARNAKEKAACSGREEITISEIYEQMPEKFRCVKKQIIEAELHGEIKCCFANPVLRDVYDWCLNNGRNVYIISDMYMPKAMVERILEKCGYRDYCKLYLSSNIGLKKQTGRLFEYVIKDSKLDIHKHIHIGDNIRTDYLAARKVGINAYKIPTSAVRGIFARSSLGAAKNEEFRRIQTIVNNYENPKESDFYKYGFEVVGLALYGFVSWLHKEFKKNNYNKVFFLARDGFLMQKAYNMLYAGEAVPNGYLYVSRKSLLSPQFWMTPTIEDLLEPETAYKYWNCEEFCRLLGIDPVEGTAKWKQEGLNENKRLSKQQILSDERVRKFFDSYQEEIVARSKKEFDAVVAYLKQEGLSGYVAIVDIGWAGAIQKYLNKYINASDINAKIFGYYFGFKQKTVAGLDAVSYIPRNLNPSLFCSQLIEYPFTKQVGTTLSYEKELDGEVKVILDEYEFKDTADDKCTAEIQRGMIDFIKLINMGYGDMDINYNAAYGKLRAVTKKPKVKDVNLFGSLAHVNHGHTSYLAMPKSVLYYMIHPRDFKIDFSFSGWKIGFLKKILLLPLPYNWLLEKVRGTDK